MSEAIEMRPAVLRRLAAMVLGDHPYSGIFPNRSHRQIWPFFDDLLVETHDEVGTRPVRAEGFIRQLAMPYVGSQRDASRCEFTPDLAKAISALVDPAEFLHDDSLDHATALAKLSEVLVTNGLKVRPRDTGSGFHATPIPMVDAQVDEGTPIAASARQPVPGLKAARTRLVVPGGSRADTQATAAPDGNLSVKPLFKLPALREVQPLRCGVLMPFGGMFDELYRNELHPVILQAGFSPLRADEMWKNVAVVDDIFHLIFTSGILVADLSGRNANVFYELGIAHMLG